MPLPGMISGPAHLSKRDRALAELRSLVTEGAIVFTIARRQTRTYSFLLLGDVVGEGIQPIYLTHLLTELGYRKATVDGYFAIRVDSFLSPSAVVDQIAYDLYGRTGALKHREI